MKVSSWLHSHTNTNACSGFSCYENPALKPEADSGFVRPEAYEIGGRGGKLRTGMKNCSYKTRNGALKGLRANKGF